ncbi:Flp family type IVb pilin [uncultured Methylobacterium sp.]|uniref:Flp family type IVb pilin n=1 Tax=uncultured Methylobacterium sp. TaxID=157278 RepID=UPI0035CA1365
MSRPVVDPRVELRAGETLETAGARFATDAAGATSIEYALIAGLIFVVICSGLRLSASKVNDVYLTIGNTVTQN